MDYVEIKYLCLGVSRIKIGCRMRKGSVRSLSFGSAKSLVSDLA